MVYRGTPGGPILGPKNTTILGPGGPARGLGPPGYSRVLQGPEGKSSAPASPPLGAGADDFPPVDVDSRVYLDVVTLDSTDLRARLGYPGPIFACPGSPKRALGGSFLPHFARKSIKN